MLVLLLQLVVYVWIYGEIAWNWIVKRNGWTRISREIL